MHPKIKDRISHWVVLGSILLGIAVPLALRLYFGSQGMLD